MGEIERCPLCWCIARPTEPEPTSPDQREAGYGYYSYGVACDANLSCGCRVDNFPTQLDAIAAWNTRPALGEAPAQPAPDAGMEVVGYLVKLDGEYPTLWDNEDIAKKATGGEAVPLVTLASANARISAVEAERGALQAVARKLTKCLVGLTPGGSEYFTRHGDEDYFADTEACERIIRDRFATGHQAKIDRVDMTRRAEAAERRLAEVPKRIMAMQVDVWGPEFGMASDDERNEKRAFNRVVASIADSVEAFLNGAAK